MRKWTITLDHFDEDGNRTSVSFSNACAENEARLAGKFVAMTMARVLCAFKDSGMYIVAHDGKEILDSFADVMEENWGNGWDDTEQVTP